MLGFGTFTQLTFTQFPGYFVNPTPPPVGDTFEWIIRARRRGRR